MKYVLVESSSGVFQIRDSNGVIIAGFYMKEHAELFLQALNNKKPQCLPKI